MPIQNTSNLTSGVSTHYAQAYQDAAMGMRLYDQFAMPVSAALFDLEQRIGLGSTYTFPFISEMTPSSTAVSESVDLVPQALRDAVSTITPTSLMDGLQWSQLLDLSVFTDYGAKRYEVLGRNMMLSVDNQARNAALQGNLIYRPAARASLDAGTTTHNFNEANFNTALTMAQSLHMPNAVRGDSGLPKMQCLVHSDAYYDLYHSGNVVSVAIYQDKGILLNGELGQLSGCRIAVSPFAKVFGAAGAANGTSAGYTTSAAANALATTVSVTTGTNNTAGRLLLIGTIETANTHHDTNERVRVVSGTTTATIVGQGANGGLLYDHASGVAFDNHDHVYPVVFGTPESLVKVWAKEVGEFGEVVGPNVTGLVEQWQTLGWKWFGGYGRFAENRLIRAEFSSSLDA